MTTFGLGKTDGQEITEMARQKAWLEHRLREKGEWE